MTKKACIIGAGIVGCVLARELSEHGYRVLMLERRNHIGGNMYDYVDEHGIRVQKYGPHIFHTDQKSILEYVRRFCQWQEFHLVCGAMIDGKCVPTAFNFETIDTFFSKSKAQRMKAQLQQTFPGREAVPVMELLESSDPLIREYAQFLYDKDYSLYTAKQWGIATQDVDPSVLERVPVKLSYVSGYFNDDYQYMPVRGYMELIHNLVDSSRIAIWMNVDAMDYLSRSEDYFTLPDFAISDKDTVIYTGPLDELFACQYGCLPYRSLRFEWKYDDKYSLQPMAVVAYPQAQGYTRITEFKKLPVQNVVGTTYAVEYPVQYIAGQEAEPYYPIQSEENDKLYQKYLALADKVKNLVCCGRLAEYKYYNMDQAIAKALQVAEKILKEGDD